jgi:hypothetical protein
MAINQGETPLLLPKKLLIAPEAASPSQETPAHAKIQQ